MMQKLEKIPLALDGNFGNIYVGFNVGSYESPTAVGVYLGGSSCRKQSIYL